MSFTISIDSPSQGSLEHKKQYLFVLAFIEEQQNQYGKGKELNARFEVIAGASKGTPLWMTFRHQYEDPSEPKKSATTRQYAARALSAFFASIGLIGLEQNANDLVDRPFLGTVELVENPGYPAKLQIVKYASIAELPAEHRKKADDAIAEHSKRVRERQGVSSQSPHPISDSDVPF